MNAEFGKPLSMLLFSALSMLWVSGCSPGTNDAVPDTDEKSKPVVLVSTVGREDLRETLVYPIDIQPENKVSVNALLSERIVKFPWSDGDRIEKGQIVAKIRADNASQSLLQVRAEMESLDAQIQNQKSELARADNLLAAKVITRQNYDQLDAAVRVSEAKRKSLEAVLSQSAISAGHAVIRAPISGIIANKRVNEGDLAAPQIPLCDIMTVDPMKIVLKLTEKDSTAVHVDQSVLIELDAYPGKTFEGRITKILPYIDPATRTNQAEVLLPNPADPDTGLRTLKSGMFGRAKIIAKERKNAVAIPEKALILEDSRADRSFIAYVVDKDDIARRRAVRTGIREGDKVEVLEGLKDGEQLVVRGQYGLADGRPVTIFNKPSGSKENKEPSK